MRPIPPQLREEMANDIFYKKCCLDNEFCSYGKIDWHHNLQYAGKQVNEKWCILPLCKYHHDTITYCKDNVDEIMLKRATYDELQQYSKAINYVGMKLKLDAKNNKTKKTS